MRSHIQKWLTCILPVFTLLIGADVSGLAATESTANKAYFLKIDGRALPVKQILVNNVNVLGGAVISLSLPINISGYTKPGNNTVQVDYISDPKSNLVVQLEKRTPGPRSEELAKITTVSDDSNKMQTASVSFDLPADAAEARVGELKDSDKTEIANQFERYYLALASAKAGRVKSLYRQSLNDERKLCPEAAKFFENVLDREVAILKNKNLKLKPLLKDGLTFKVEGDVVKLFRTTGGPLIESNEVKAEVAPLLIEVGAGKVDKSIGQNTDSRLPRAPKEIEIPASAFTPADKPVPPLIEVHGSDGSIAATEIAIDDTETTIFDGSKQDTTAQSLPGQPGSANGARPTPRVTAKSASLPRTAVQERLIRSSLYFKPIKSKGSGRRTWVVSLPPNV